MPDKAGFQSMGLPKEGFLTPICEGRPYVAIRLSTLSREPNQVPLKDAWLG